VSFGLYEKLTGDVVPPDLHPSDAEVRDLLGDELWADVADILPRCAECGRVILGRRADAVWCSASCKKKSYWRRRRARDPA
jgi:hypothetical protein